MTHTARTTAALRRGLPISVFAAASTFLAACGQSPMVLDTSSTSESVDSEPTATDIYPTGESSATDSETSSEKPSASPAPESLAEDPYLAPNAFIPQPGEDTASEPTRVVPEGRVTDQSQLPGLTATADGNTSEPSTTDTAEPEQGDTAEPKPPTSEEKKDPAGGAEKDTTGEGAAGPEKSDPLRAIAQGAEGKFEVPPAADNTGATDTGSSEPQPGNEPAVPAPAPEPKPAPKPAPKPGMPGSSSMPTSSLPMSSTSR